ncbi:MAG: galactokinase [Bacteroidales bacterium]|nr:galactokinase [Bacteroidales bacterium]
MQYHIFSPYRICPVGAHSDHQHGLVTGFPFNKGVDLYFDVTEDGSVELESGSFDGKVSFDIRQKTILRQGNWGDYALGAKYALRKRFELKRGIRGKITGSLPVGGLSSSAAVLVSYVMAFAKANDISLMPMEVVLIASEAEREYIGLNNGLLDQSCIVLGKKDHMLMLDCDSNEYRVIPRNPKMKDFEFGVFFSGLTRSLISSDFNLRVQECKVAAWDLLSYDDQPIKPFDKTFMRDVPRNIYEKHKDKLPRRFANRAEHYFSEYKRVRQAVTAWESGNIEWLGQLSFESCESSIHNWECGSPELISIYRAMRNTDGIYGGRFSGAGFKGACIALVDPSKEDAIRESITSQYLAEFPQYKDTFEVHFVKSADGAGFVED